MRDLTEIRQQIDQIDQKMLALFKERMGCSAEVAEYKRGTGKAIYDPVRERQKIDALTKDEDELIIKKVCRRDVSSDDEYQPKISV